jgi:hypothetical protein
VSTELLSVAAGVNKRELTELLALVAASDVVELDVAFPAGRLSLRRRLAALAVAPIAEPDVDAPASGTIEDVLVADSGPVEFGQTLLLLRVDGVE